MMTEKEEEKLKNNLTELHTDWFKSVLIRALQEVCDRYIVNYVDEDQEDLDQPSFVLAWDIVTLAFEIDGMLKFLCVDRKTLRYAGSFQVLIQRGCHSPAEWIPDWSWREGTPEGEAFNALLEQLTEIMDAEQ